MTRPLLLLAFLVGVLAPVAATSAPSSAADYGALTGRVVGADGAPVAGARLNLFRQGSNVAASHGYLSGEDGTFTITAARLDDPAAGPYRLLVGNGGSESTAIPTWYDGTGADGGIRGETSGGDPATGRSTAASVPAGAATLTFGAAPINVGDLQVQEGALVEWDSRDTNGKGDFQLRVTGPLAGIGRVDTYESNGDSGPLLEPGRHTFALEASATDPGGRQQVTLDLAPGDRLKVPVTWAARYYLYSIGTTWGHWFDPLPGERPGVGTRLRSEVELANNIYITKAVVKVQWYRGSTAIPGATGRGYRLTAADRGKRISYRVTVKARPGYAAASYRSPKTKAAAVAARVDARFVGRSVLVKVRWSNGARPRGEVALLLHGSSRFREPLATKTLRNRRGEVRLRIPAGFVRGGDTGVEFVVRYLSPKRKVSVAYDFGPSAALADGVPGSLY